MDWDNYLLEEKAPADRRAELGVVEGEVSKIYDLSQLPTNAKVINLATPLKKTKLKYTHYEALIGNENIEGICINDIDEERLSIFSSLPNLKYLRLRNNKQEQIPNLSRLQSLEVLILANLTRVREIDFVIGMDKLKTLFVCDVTNLYDLSPLSHLTSLRELSLENGGMSGVGKPAKSMEPISKLAELRYLQFLLTTENKNYDVAPLFGLKKLEKLTLLPRYLNNGGRERLLAELPLLETV